MLQFQSEVRSDVGAVRSNNEDSAFAGSTLLMVADGVGGAAAGEVASASVTYVVSAAALLATPGWAPDELLLQTFRFAHRQILDEAQACAERWGMATTATAVLTDGRSVTIAHVGDSRAYRYARGRLTQLTRDDSFLQDLLDTGEVQPADAAAFAYRNLITKSIGQQGELEVAVVPVELRSGDRILVCSDGVSDVLDEVELARALSSERRAADDIVALALERGSSDNVTCVVADVVDRPWVRPWGVLAGAGWNPGNLIDATAVRRRAGSENLQLSGAD
ncbi:PP2C family protein-serine/threonine phosphatase [Desertihabitans brevis]|uniref:PP2C family protein-serine/threonine phosphatase n=1 Tax=Desertihabitans brevis TaxID=2268447 RepID=UPI0013145AA7|nr:protein phosphatase 2C domain-containing protein [Desertihabitans brevis]